MSFQWTVVAVFLYVEIAVLIILMLPWIRPPMWQKLFKSRLARSMEKRSVIASYVLTSILLLLFFDAIRGIAKYTGPADSKEAFTQTAHGEAMLHMRLFRAQRNLYISGFALFFAIVIRRIVQLIGREAHLMAAVEAAIRQGRNASDAAKNLLNQTEGEEDGEESEVTRLRATVANIRKEMEEIEDDRDAIKEQAESIKQEYDRLLNERKTVDTDYNDKEE